MCFMLGSTNANPKMACKFDKSMIDAYCQCLNLAAKQWLKEAVGSELEKDLDTIKAIMFQASTLKGRGALKEFTPYARKIMKLNGKVFKIWQSNTLKSTWL